MAIQPSFDENLAAISPKDKPWNRHKKENVLVGVFYGESSQFRRYSERMGECASWLEFGELEEHDKKLKLTRANFCHVRQCPICQWRRTMALHARFMKNLPDYLSQFPDYAYVSIVLTSRNPAMADLRATIRWQNDAVKKILKRKAVAKVVKGYVRTNEVTKGEDGNPHPHIHLIIAVNKSYFTSRDYLSHDQWVALWRESLGIDYDPSVHVSRVKAKKRKKDMGGDSQENDIIAGLIEINKYDTKPADVVDDKDFLYGITLQCHKLRFLSTGGCLKDIFANSNGADPEGGDITDSEMLLQDEDSEEKLTGWRQVYFWKGRNYRLDHRVRIDADGNVVEQDNQIKRE